LPDNFDGIAAVVTEGPSLATDACILVGEVLGRPDG